MLSSSLTDVSASYTVVDNLPLVIWRQKSRMEGKRSNFITRLTAVRRCTYYAGGRRVQKNFSDKAEAKGVAKQILGELTNDSKAVEAMATPELESLIAARKVLASGYALHVAGSGLNKKSR